MIELRVVICDVGGGCTINLHGLCPGKGRTHLPYLPSVTSAHDPGHLASCAPASRPTAPPSTIALPAAAALACVAQRNPLIHFARPNRLDRLDRHDRLDHSATVNSNLAKLAALTSEQLLPLHNALANANLVAWFLACKEDKPEVTSSETAAQAAKLGLKGPIWLGRQKEQPALLSVQTAEEAGAQDKAKKQLSRFMFSQTSGLYNQHFDRTIRLVYATLRRHIERLYMSTWLRPFFARRVDSVLGQPFLSQVHIYLSHKHAQEIVPILKAANRYHHDKNLRLYQARIKNSANVAPYDSTIPLITWTAVHHGKSVITKFHPKTMLATFWDR
ncbi:uncharacterized protein JCM10292_001666 [Rhodotorula paludigena]|uniref:uncharacterized protein n=1 Tax=Rhodotorula paludigena TaxID=86838 RepID=UPI00317700E5